MRVNMQDKVRSILKNNKDTRDSDVLLIFKFWKNEYLKRYPDMKEFHKLPTGSLFSMWDAKHLTHPSAIMRARRKVQEKHSDTRGKLWYKRHKEQETVKEDLGYAKRIRV